MTINTTTAHLNKKIEEMLISSLETSKKNPLIFKGKKPDKAFIDELAKAKKSSLEEMLCKGVLILLEENDKEIKFKDWKNKLEDGFNKLIKYWNNNKGKCSADTLALIARLYLLRSILFRPKGFTIPKKKTEALKKGLEFVNKAGENKNALKIKALIYLEQEKLKINQDDIEEVLLQAVNKGCKVFDINNNETLFNLWICLRYCELQAERNGTLNEFCEKILKNIIGSHPNDFHFEKARAYYLLRNSNIDQMKIEMKLAIQNLEDVSFSNPIWNEVIKFIKVLREKDIEVWKEIALKVYEVCEQNSKYLSNPFIRLYWAGLRDLYDLAFIASDDIKVKTEIADASKNRTSLPYAVWGKEVTEAERIADEASLMGRHISNLSRIYKKDKNSLLNKRDLETLPPKWTAVHFYLNHLEKEEGKENYGYALIYDKKEKKWSIQNFSVSELYQAFLTWQTDYSKGGISNFNASYLVKLCKCIGSTMQFLFNVQNESIIFIPHDFIRRLPLHGAIRVSNGEEEVLTENHKCFYIPNWCNTFPPKNNETKDIFIIQYPSNNTFSDIINYKILDELESLSSMVQAPQLLIILCKNISDYVNPFNSKLLISKKGKAMRELLFDFTANLKGSRVFIGACESDFIPPLTNPVDEHLSLSLPFLNNGASEIISTMWEVYEDDLKIIVNDINPDSLWKWQKEKIREYKDGDTNNLYRAVAFRIISPL